MLRLMKKKIKEKRKRNDYSKNSTVGETLTQQEHLKIRRSDRKQSFLRIKMQRNERWREEEEALLVVKEKAGQVFRMRITDRYEISDSINGEIITDWRTQGMDAKTDGRRAAKDFSWIVNTDQSLCRLGLTLHFKPLPGAFANCTGATWWTNGRRLWSRGGEKKRFLRGSILRGGNTVEHRLDLDEEQKEKSRLRSKGINQVRPFTR